MLAQQAEGVNICAGVSGTYALKYGFPLTPALSLEGEGVNCSYVKGGGSNWFPFLGRRLGSKSPVLGERARVSNQTHGLSTNTSHSICLHIGPTLEGNARGATYLYM